MVCFDLLPDFVTRNTPIYNRLTNIVLCLCVPLFRVRNDEVGEKRPFRYGALRGCLPVGCTA